jgi:hypothetical protein
MFLAGVFGPGSALWAAPGSPQIPFSFVRNAGQEAAGVLYAGTGPDCKAWFSASGFSLRQGDRTYTVRFVGGAASPRIEMEKPLGAEANYLRGADPRQWQTGLPMFQSLVYREVWPGIDVRFRVDGSVPKPEFVIGPGASAAAVRLSFDGDADAATDGSLIVRNSSGEIRGEAPRVFRKDAGGETLASAGFKRVGDGTIGLDTSRPKSVTPISFSGYFGGASQSAITGVAVNSYYNTIVVGWTTSTNLPASAGAQQHYAGSVDAFVAGFSPVGGALLFCTYLGGSGQDEAMGVAVDSSNNTYITGWTTSSNFPTVNPLQSKLKGTRDAFVAKLNPAGNALLYSTYLGGSGADSGYAIAVDASGSAYLIGDTTSTNLPVTAGTYQSALAGAQDVFLAKLSPAGNAVSWLTYYGGSGTDHGAALKLDATGAVVFGGATYSQDLPTHLAFQANSGGGQDGFVGRLSGDGTTLLLSTYIGGSGGSAGAPEEVNAVTLGASGFIIFAGTTSSTNFPVVAADLQPLFGGGNTDGFIGRINPASGVLNSCTYLGGSGDDGINGIASDAASTMYVTGYTTSGDFPTVNPIQASYGGGMDAFVAKLSFTQILFSSYWGGPGPESGYALAVDSLTNIVLVGTTGSSNLPAVGTVGRFTGSPSGSFVSKLAANFTLGAAAMPTVLFDVWHDSGYNGPNVTLNSATYGQAGDIPLMGDWDGTGKKRIGVFRSGTWYLDMNGNGVIDSGDKTVSFGQAGDLPVLGDWNGTGRIKLGLFRNGAFILDLSGHLSGVPTGLADLTYSFGMTGDIPVVADWSGSGTTKVGVFRNGLWLVDYNGDGQFNSLDPTYSYGMAGDFPVVGDWGSTGLANQLGVYRGGLWILNITGSNLFGITKNDLTVSFGSAAYRPLPY